MKFENWDVWGVYNAIRGARNPMDSWDKSDSEYDFESKYTYIGPNDLDLLQRLIKAGPEHRKFMRQIFVSVDITAPLYWWKEFDKYQIGVTTNSCSTMHKLTSYPITIDCFEMCDFNENTKVYDCEPYSPDTYIREIWEDAIIPACETLRQRYIETKDKSYWKELVRILPESWLQKRTVTMNYENLYSIVRQRKGHKLTEWDAFIDWVKNLSYSKELLFYEY